MPNYSSSLLLARCHPSCLLWICLGRILDVAVSLLIALNTVVPWAFLWHHCFSEWMLDDLNISMVQRNIDEPYKSGWKMVEAKPYKITAIHLENATEVARASSNSTVNDLKMVRDAPVDPS